MQNVTIKHGDILDEPVDIIVSTANPQLLMSGGVNGAILMRGGHNVQARLQDHLKSLGRRYVEPGSVVVTGPGPLQCRHILHAVSINALYESSPDLIAQTIRNVLNAAIELNATSIAIPALATGYGPLSMSDFATCVRTGPTTCEMQEALDRLDIRIVLWRSEDVDVVRRIINATQTDTSVAGE